MLETIKEINLLWGPVFPYLANFITSIFGKTKGTVAEAGPFCGAIYELSKKGTGDEFYILSFPPGMDEFYREELARRALRDIRIIPIDPSFDKIANDSFDLIFSRGFFFFPSIFRSELSSILRILKKGGIAIVGGGFGIETPEEIIEQIKERSKILNQKLGKIETSVKEIHQRLYSEGLKDNATVVEEGGLWVVLRK